MITQARDAIRTAILATYSPAEPPTIHIRQLPAGFARPAFYLHPLPMSGREAGSGLRDFPMSWQLVYFPAEDAFSNPAADDAYAAMERLEDTFGAVKSLTGPSGEVFHLTNYSADYRDDVVYAGIGLQTMRKRADPADTSTLMGVLEMALTAEKEQ